MPKTKLGEALRKSKEIAAKRLETRKRKIERRRTVRNSEYKKFCDICFETYVRWRDSWIDTLDGTRYTPGDYEHYHACHFIPREVLATRYLEENCHGQSSGHNWAMSSKATPIIRLRTQRIYTDFLKKKYGYKKVNELFKLSKTLTHLFDWRCTAKRLYEQAISLNKDAIEARLKQCYRTLEEKHALNLILSEIQNSIDSNNES